ncbi:NAD(P)-dependent oxidoreductase (plasmid) [Azospirillum sp. TSA2s]|uniref:NAD-dependent epimerase/dehydratase family protein n=1 Tax=Azospirillum sp. TSA2s TaxID=709810 RepID=UPI0010AA7822|nr:NAD(P)-dependent oxidoreductase [Azospirillum sp. TSA2s]QCG93166.1 NAD(P)-dependent oxidoreductase [Azospirillum sp. TSA2s]
MSTLSGKSAAAPRLPFTRLAGRRVLVAGATGMVGTAIVRALLAADPEVEVVGIGRSTPPGITSPRITHVGADLTRREDCRRAVAGCDWAVLAAAETGGAAQARREPWRQVTDNVVMDSLLLEALHDAGVRRVVYIGSASAYQPFDGLIREDQMAWDADPHPAYLGVGWAKRYIEKQCRFWQTQTRMATVVVRAANVYGPRARFDPENSNVVAALVRKAVDHMDPFEYWGSLDVARDIIHADDFARAVLHLLVCDEAAGETFNLGSGRPTTVEEIMTCALRAAGHQPRAFRQLGEAPTTIPFRGLDCTKIERLTGWMPEISVEDGIRQTVDWWRDNKEVWKR